MSNSHRPDTKNLPTAVLEAIGQMERGEPFSASEPFDQRTAAMHKLEQELAYSAARSDIECQCIAEETVPLVWYDTSEIAMAYSLGDSLGEVRELVARAITYLEWRGCIERREGQPHILRIKEAS